MQAIPCGGFESFVGRKKSDSTIVLPQTVLDAYIAYNDKVATYQSESQTIYDDFS